MSSWSSWASRQSRYILGSMVQKDMGQTAVLVKLPVARKAVRMRIASHHVETILHS